MKIEEEKLWSQMEFARFEHETEFMKEQIRLREEERMRRMETASAREQDFQRRLEMEREQQKVRESMFDFNVSNSSKQNMGIQDMMEMMQGGRGGGGDIWASNSGMGNPDMGGRRPSMGNPIMGSMNRMSEEKFNPAIWDELRTPETGSRPRYPNEVFGRGGGKSGR